MAIKTTAKSKKTGRGGSLLRSGTKLLGGGRRGMFALVAIMGLTVASGVYVVNQASAATNCYSAPPLKLNSRGPCVVLVQRKFNVTVNGRYTGFYGPTTQAKVVQYQTARRIPKRADGIVGNNTWTYMCRDMRAHDDIYINGARIGCIGYQRRQGLPEWMRYYSGTPRPVSY